MTKAKTTKRALVLSALSLIVCVSMLVGSTFAWFTDSVTSSGNIIKSGTLDVTMEWAEGKNDPATTAWKNAADGAIFNYNLWEPGYTEVRHIKIANVGSLALKYQLNIVATGTVSELADVIDVYYADPAIQVASRDALAGAQKLGTLSEVLANVKTSASGELLATESDTITIALKMQESAGNEYQNKSIGSEFAVQLLATQYTYEEDSFGSDYDAGACDFWDGVSADDSWYTADPSAAEFVLDSGADLAGFAALVNSGKSFANKTIKLATDVDMMGATWTPVGISSSKAFYGTFDGQNHTIANFTLSTSSGTYGAGFFGNILHGAAVKNVTFDSVSYDGRANVAAVVTGYVYGSATFENVHVTNANIKAFGKVAGIVGLVADPGAHTVTLTNCSVEGTIGGGYNVGGLMGLVLQGVTVNLSGCTTDVDFILNDCGYNQPYVKDAEGNWMWNYYNAWNYAAVAENYCYYDAAENERFNGVAQNVTIVAASSNQLSSALANGAETVNVAAGTYTFPASSINAGQTIICDAGTVFTGTSDLNIKGATVVGATFDAGSTSTVATGNVDGTFKNCTFQGGSEGLRWCYAGDNAEIVFENCVFKTTLRGFHFDGTSASANITFKNCEINGFNAFGGDATFVFDGCTFGNDASKYNGLNIYTKTVLKNCTFKFNSGKTNFIDLEASGLSLTIENCTATLDGVAANVADYVGGSKLTSGTVTYN